MNTGSARSRWTAGACAAFLLLIFCADTQEARAQHDQGGTHPVAVAPSRIEDAFVREARAATSRYQDVDAAVAAGYRKMGPDMPNMGEHWIQPSMAARGSLDPARPPVLTYLPTDSGKVLTGVAFTAPVRPGEAPPEMPLNAQWHFHIGGLEEEAFGHKHAAMHHADEDRTRLAMIHAWIWVDNPDGTFAADNWALPFVRLGISRPSQATPCAAKAAFLLSGGVEYYTRMAQTATELTPAELAAVQTTLEMYRLKVEKMLDGARGFPVDAEALSQLWSELWEVVAQNVNEEARRELSMLSGNSPGDCD